MTTVDIHPEFGIELALGLPYVYWLHENNQLEKVVTSKGMKPFYYFCDDVVEDYMHRSLDNVDSGLNKIPNSWIHMNTLAVYDKSYEELTEDERIQVHGVLDYSQWTPPPYSEYYKTSEFDHLKPYVVINNNLEKCFSKIKSLIDTEKKNGSKDYDSEYIRNHINKLTS